MNERTASAIEAFSKIVLDHIRYDDSDSVRVKQALEAHEELLDALANEHLTS